MSIRIGNCKGNISQNDAAFSNLNKYNTNCKGGICGNSRKITLSGIKFWF